MAPAERQPFAVIAKPVGSRCNLRCRYCYYLEKGKYSTHEVQNRMSNTLLERLIRQTIEASPGPVVSFTWHGGEPSLAGLDFYEKVVYYEKRYLPRGWQVWNNLQTNGTLLNEEWCRFIRDNGFDVGVSIDGTELVHDRNRLDIGGHPTYSRVTESIRRLQKYGVNPDLLCTVTSDSSEFPKDTYRALRDLGTEWIQFIPVIVRLPDGTMTRESVTPEAYGRFLCEIFEEWVANDLGKTDVQLFAETSRVWAGGEPSLCWMTGTCGRVLVVEEDGGIYSCDHFVDSEHRLGTLPSTRLEDALNSEFQYRFGQSKRESLTRQCRECPHLDACGGGCLKDRFALSDDGEEGMYYLCGGLKMFFDHARPVLEKVMQWSRNGDDPAAIMNKLRKERSDG